LRTSDCKECKSLALVEIGPLLILKMIDETFDQVADQQDFENLED
jgi:hypothetical protein